MCLCLFLAGESEPNVTPLDVHTAGGGAHLEQQESQSKSNQEGNANPSVSRPIKKVYTTPKIWMDFDDFCSCFVSVVVFHNPRGYQYVHKHTEVKVMTGGFQCFASCPSRSLELMHLSALLVFCSFAGNDHVWAAVCRGGKSVDLHLLVAFLSLSTYQSLIVQYLTSIRCLSKWSSFIDIRGDSNETKSVLLLTMMIRIGDRSLLCFCLACCCFINERKEKGSESTCSSTTTSQCSPNLFPSHPTMDCSLESSR